MMKSWIKGSQKHFVFWSVFLLYAFSAVPLYNHFLLKNGKPAGNEQAFSPSGDVTFKLGDLRPVVLDGQDFYELKGFAFNKKQPTAPNSISIILNGQGQNLIFHTNAAPYPDMIASSKGYTKAMDHAEFRWLLAKNVLKPGKYQIGILLEAKDGSKRSYVPTGAVLNRTPNTLKYTPGP